MAKKSQTVLDLEARIAELESKLASQGWLENNNTDHQNTIHQLQDENARLRDDNSKLTDVLAAALEAHEAKQEALNTAKILFTVLRKLAKVRGTVAHASFNVKQKNNWNYLPTVLDANGAKKLSEELKTLTCEWVITKKENEFYFGWKSAKADTAVGE